MGKNQNARHAVGSSAFLVARRKNNNMTMWWNRRKILVIVSLFLFLARGMTELAYLQSYIKWKKARSLLRKFLGSGIFSFHPQIPLNFLLPCFLPSPLRNPALHRVERAEIVILTSERARRRHFKISSLPLVRRFRSIFLVVAV